jgi:hypothetical protein
VEAAIRVAVPPFHGGNISSNFIQDANGINDLPGLVLIAKIGNEADQVVSYARSCSNLGIGCNAVFILYDWSSNLWKSGVGSDVV